MIPVMLVSANYFDTLGVGAALGRPLMPQDGKPGAPAAVVLSDIGWRRFFDADPAIVGRPAFVDGRPATIVGVLPASFTGTFAPMVPQIYAPLIERPATTYPVDLIGRLKPGVSAPQARADLSRIAAQLTASDGRRRVIETYPPTVVLTRSLMTPITAGRGFEGRGVLMTTIAIDDTYTPERRALFFRSLTESLERAAGVSAVTAVDNIPTANSHPAPWTEMRSGERVVRVSSNHIAPEFFRTLGIPLLAGRDFTSRDDPKSGAVGIVNETLASRLWPGLSAVGQRLQAPDGSSIEVVGLARESKYEAADEAPTPFLYRPMAQGSIAAPTFLIGTTGDPAATLSLVRARIAEFDPDLAPYNVMALDDRLSLGVIANRAAAVVSGSMGLVALVLSAMGIYGTMSFLVQQRRREIGVRIALGASRRNVVSLITRQGMTWTAAGLAIGLAGGLAAALLLAARPVSIRSPLCVRTDSA